MRGEAVTGVNPVTSVGFAFGDPLADSRHLFALAPVCFAERSPALGGSNVPNVHTDDDDSRGRLQPDERPSRE